MIEVKEIYQKIEEYKEKEVTLKGWIRNHRKQKYFGFIDFSDGSCFEHLQIVYDDKMSDFDDILKLHIGSSISYS